MPTKKLRRMLRRLNHDLVTAIESLASMLAHLHLQPHRRHRWHFARIPGRGRR